ncbi:MAG: right-handed parallel beta-helix repeat-containing protein [Candidatus Lernaella stagnicola]|nr:right-handed parallel beta-helix repeat-containing protein [Candidatus Lernaella stagnicola]
MKLKTLLLVFLALALVAGCSSDDGGSDDNDGGSDDDVDDDEAVTDDDAADDDATDDDATDDDDDDDNDNDDDDDDDNDIAPGENYAPAPTDEVGYFVTPGGDDANPGTMAEPFATVSQGMLAAYPAGKVLFVAEGVYRETVKIRVPMFGGYSAGSWDRDIDAHPTKIAPPAGTATKVPVNERAAEIVIEGFDLVGSFDDGNGDGGDGLVTHGDHIVIHRNRIDGGFYMPNYGTTIGLRIGGGNDILIHENEIDGGSGFGWSVDCVGVWIEGGAVAFLAHNEISGGASQSTWDQAFSIAVHIANRGRAVLVGNRLSARAGQGSYGVELEGEGVLINNYIAVSPYSSWPVPVVVDTIYGVFPPRAVIVNNIIRVMPSVAGSNAAGIYLGDSGAMPSVWVFNNDFWNPLSGYLMFAGGHPILTANAINLCAWQGCEGAADNLLGDPFFAGLGDVHLTQVSPCVDAGADPSTWHDNPWNAWDFDFDPRPQGDAWDIGPDEFVPAAARRP